MMRSTLYMYCLLLAACSCSAARAQEKDSRFLAELLYSNASAGLKKVLDNPDSFHYQIIYTQIDRDHNNRPVFTHHFLHVNADQYYNPASTVKLPVALAALEKLHAAGIGRNTPMLTDSSYPGQTAVLSDTSSANGLPSVAQYIRKIFLVSDNDAYNRLYEFCGQQYLNELLWKKGYTGTRILRRFTGMTEDGNRHTNAVRFLIRDTAQRVFAAGYSRLTPDYSKPVLVGQAHWDLHDSLVHAPMDFTRHNRLPLQELQYMLQSVLFPSSVPARRRFRFSEDDRRFLLRYLSCLPSESVHPKYDTSVFFDSYTKFFLYKASRQKPTAHIRIFNKPGWSYGYLTDAAYIADFENGIECMLSANIYVNRDGVLNDNKYEYDETGYPFFKEIGEIIYRYELSRRRKHRPDLSAFRLDYGPQ